MAPTCISTDLCSSPFLLSLHNNGYQRSFYGNAPDALHSRRLARLGSISRLEEAVLQSLNGRRNYIDNTKFRIQMQASQRGIATEKLEEKVGIRGIGQDEAQGAAALSEEDRGQEEEEFAKQILESRPSPIRIEFNYGFQAKFLRSGATVPGNIFRLAFENYGREWRALRRSYLFKELAPINLADINGGSLDVFLVYAGRAFILAIRGLDKFLTLYDGLRELKPESQEFEFEQDELRENLKKLVLSNDAVWDRERRRPQVEAPWWILGPYYLLCVMLDVIFKDRPIQRFWFLETVARMPYFSYISMLHLYETLGCVAGAVWLPVMELCGQGERVFDICRWRAGAEVRKVHFAEMRREIRRVQGVDDPQSDIRSDGTTEDTRNGESGREN